MRKRQNHTDTGTRLLMRFSELAGAIFTATRNQPNTKTKEGDSIHSVWSTRDQRRCSILVFASPCVSSWWYKLHHFPGHATQEAKEAMLACKGNHRVPQTQRFVVYTASPESPSLGYMLVDSSSLAQFCCTRHYGPRNLFQ